MIDPSEHASFVFNLLQYVNSDPKVTPGASRVFFWLTHHLNRETHMCWPSIKRLAKVTGLNRDTVLAAIHNLETAGYIEVMREHRRNNVYTALERKKWMMRLESEKPTQRSNARTLPQRNVTETFQPVESEKPTQPSRKSRPKVVGNSDPNHLSRTHLKENAWCADAHRAEIQAEGKKKSGQELNGFRHQAKLTEPQAARGSPGEARTKATAPLAASSLGSSKKGAPPKPKKPRGYPDYDIFQKQDGTLVIESLYSAKGNSEADLTAYIDDMVRRDAEAVREGCAPGLFDSALETLKYRLDLLRWAKASGRVFPRDQCERPTVGTPVCSADEANRNRSSVTMQTLSTKEEVKS